MSRPTQTAEKFSFIPSQDVLFLGSRDHFLYALKYWLDQDLHEDFCELVFEGRGRLRQYCRSEGRGERFKLQAHDTVLKGDSARGNDERLGLFFREEGRQFLVRDRVEEVHLRQYQKRGIPVEWELAIELASGRVTANPCICIGRNLYDNEIYMDPADAHWLYGSGDATEVILGTLSEPVLNYRPLAVPERLGECFEMQALPQHYGYAADARNARVVLAEFLLKGTGRKIVSIED